MGHASVRIVKKITCATVGELRKALDGLADGTPLEDRVRVSHGNGMHFINGKHSTKVNCVMIEDLFGFDEDDEEDFDETEGEEV